MDDIAILKKNGRAMLTGLSEKGRDFISTEIVGHHSSSGVISISEEHYDDMVKDLEKKGLKVLER